jgi:hypothetical protein
MRPDLDPHLAPAAVPAFAPIREGGREEEEVTTGSSSVKVILEGKKVFMQWKEWMVNTTALSAEEEKLQESRNIFLNI